MCMPILHVAVIDVRVLQHMMALYTGANSGCLVHKTNGPMMFTIHTTKHFPQAITKAASGVRTLNSALEAQQIKSLELGMQCPGAPIFVLTNNTQFGVHSWRNCKSSRRLMSAPHSKALSKIGGNARKEPQKQPSSR